jgi:hypothetical protein
MGQVSFGVLQFFTVSIIPPMLHTHGYLNIIIFRKTSKRGLGIFKHINALFQLLASIGQQSTAMLIST